MVECGKLQRIETRDYKELIRLVRKYSVRRLQIFLNAWETAPISLEKLKDAVRKFEARE